jgi:hypothetical protein
MTELVSPGTSASTPPKTLLPRKSMTAGEGGLALLFAIAAVASLIGAAKAEDIALAFHAYLAAPASVAAVFAVLTHYFDRPAALPLQEIGNRPNHHLGPVKLAAGRAVLWGIAGFLTQRSRRSIDQWTDRPNAVRAKAPSARALICANYADKTRDRLMMSADDLVERCNEAMRLGVDFPTLWHAIIKCDPNVMGRPVQRLEGNRTYLEIALLRGDWLVIDNEAKAVRIR